MHDGWVEHTPARHIVKIDQVAPVKTVLVWHYQLHRFRY